MSRRAGPDRPLPLIEWGEAMRRRRREQGRRRRRWVACVAPLIVVVAVSIAMPIAPRLVWNPSASAPIGLYTVALGATPRRGEFVIVRVPVAVQALAASRRYIPVNVPLLKHVGAVTGNQVCAAGSIISIDGRVAAVRRASDGVGRPMPWWRGCRRVGRGEVFLLSPDASASFDGRYFGISPIADIVGTARLLWAR